MIAKNRIQSERALFFQGGRLDILLCADVEKNIDEPQAVAFGKGLELLEECPCGCGLKNVCQGHQAKMKALNDEIPF